MFSINFSLASYIGLSAGSIAPKPILVRMKKQNVTTAIEIESTLADQPKNEELEYRVLAINQAGVGSPSNTVMVVL